MNSKSVKGKTKIKEAKRPYNQCIGCRKPCGMTGLCTRPWPEFAIRQKEGVVDCSGKDIRRVALYKCTNCGTEVEVFSDEPGYKCGKCGQYVSTEQAAPCIEWCASARQCLGEKRWQAWRREATDINGRCPGRDKDSLKAGVYRCPHCGNEVEMFTSESMVRCGKCGHYVYREQVTPCVEWWALARQCLGDKRWRALRGVYDFPETIA